LIAPSTNQQIQTAIAPNLNQKAITEISILSSHKRALICQIKYIRYNTANQRTKQMTQNQFSEVIQGGVNVFEDLGFAPEEALNLKIRADLMLNIKRFIQSQGWTQKQAALFFGETQPRISDLINGDIERFSIDKLVMMLVRAGMDVRFEVS